MNKCNKATFNSLEDAIRRSHEIRKETSFVNKVKPKSLRAYQCNYCGLFHLSSKSKFEFLSNIGKEFKQIDPKKIQDRINELKNNKQNEI